MSFTFVAHPCTHRAPGCLLPPRQPALGHAQAAHADPTGLAGTDHCPLLTGLSALVARPAFAPQLAVK